MAMLTKWFFGIIVDQNGDFCKSETLGEPMSTCFETMTLLCAGFQWGHLSERDTGEGAQNYYIK